MNGSNYRMKLTLCKLKFDDHDITFDEWECDQTGIQCQYCYIKERYDSRKSKELRKGEQE